MLALLAATATAQRVVGTVTAGSTPLSVAVNPVTNQYYVANGDFFVIDGATLKTLTIKSGAPGGIDVVAVNPATNKIYGAALFDGLVIELDGATLVTTPINVGNGPANLAIDAVTNQIYVANQNSNNVTVIDGATRKTSTVTAGATPFSIAVNPLTNTIYVANRGTSPNYTDGNVTVIDGATLKTTTVTAGTQPLCVTVNPVTNKAYVTNYSSNNVTVINGADNTTATVNVQTSPICAAVDTVRNRTYVANSNSSSVTVIDSSNNATNVTTAPGPQAVVVNPTDGQIYTANYGNNSVTVIDPATLTPTTLTAGSNPRAIAVNPVTNKVLVANQYSFNVSVIDGATNVVTTVNTGKTSDAEVVNGITNQIYVANRSANTVTVMDGNTLKTTTIATGTDPVGVALNPITNKLYAANQYSNSVTVIDGGTLTASTVAGGKQPAAIDINPVTNKIYVADIGGNTVTVIDGATQTTATVNVGQQPISLAVDPVANKVYVSNQLSNDVTVIDGATLGTTTISGIKTTGGIAVNPVTNKIYVQNLNATVTVIDGATLQSAQVNATYSGSPFVNPITNKIYLVSFPYTTVLDGATLGVTTVLSGTGGGVTINQATNRIYVGTAVIDGVSNNSVVLYGSAAARANNPITGKVYGGAPNAISILTEQQVEATQPSVAITALTNNKTSNPQPTFTFTPSGSATQQQVYYQVDTWQGPWLVATPAGGGTYTGQTPALVPGLHFIYAYATDALEGDAFQTGDGFVGQSSPRIGPIAGYEFLYAPKAKTFVLLAATPNPANVEQNVALTATVVGIGGTPTGAVTFYDGATSLGMPVNLGAGIANTTTSFITAGTHNLTASYPGDPDFSAGTSSVLYETVPFTPSATLLTTSANPVTTGTPVTFTAAVSSSGILLPGGMVNFTATGQTTQPASLNAGGMASTMFTFNSPGTYIVQANYVGDAAHSGSSSHPLPEVVNCSSCTATTTTMAPPVIVPSHAGQPANVLQLGEKASITVTVTANSGASAPTGSVQLYDSGVAVGSAQPLTSVAATTSSTATFDISNLGSGVHTIFAVYAGTPTTFGGSLSGSVNVRRSPRPR